MQSRIHHLIAITGLMVMTHGANAQSRPDTLFETYGDWAVRCQAAPEGTGGSGLCEIFQELRQQESGQRVLSIGISTDGTTTSATIIAPFGIKLSGGLNLSLAGTVLQNAPFETCMPVGCIAKASLSEETIDALKQGNTIEAVMLANTTSEEVSVSISLNGFTKAWTRLSEL